MIQWYAVYIIAIAEINNGACQAEYNTSYAQVGSFQVIKPKKKINHHFVSVRRSTNIPILQQYVITSLHRNLTVSLRMVIYNTCNFHSVIYPQNIIL